MMAKDGKSVYGNDLKNHSAWQWFDCDLTPTSFIFFWGEGITILIKYVQFTAAILSVINKVVLFLTRVPWSQGLRTPVYASLYFSAVGNYHTAWLKKRKRCIIVTNNYSMFYDKKFKLFLHSFRMIISNGLITVKVLAFCFWPTEKVLLVLAEGARDLLLNYDNLWNIRQSNFVTGHQSKNVKKHNQKWKYLY